MDSLDADQILVARENAVCTVTYIAPGTGIIIEFHMIQGIRNVDRVVLIVYGRTIASLRLRLALWLDGQQLPGVMPYSPGRLLLASRPFGIRVAVVGASLNLTHDLT